MAKVEKERNQNFYILNIKLRKTHSSNDLLPEDYTRVLKKIYKQKIHEASSKGKHCIIKFLFEEKEDGKVIYLSGTIAQFTYIDNGNWINLNNMELDDLFKVPDGLFPDAVITDFVFIPAAHRFCYRKISGVNISPYPLKNFLERALDKVTNSDEYAQVDVETNTSTMETILNSNVKKLVLDINYSNIDIGGPLKDFVENDIKASDSQRLQITATQKPDSYIKIAESKILTGALEAAMSNGDAEATIVDYNGKVEHIKTIAFPRLESVYGVLNSFNQKVYEKVMAIFRNN